VRHADDVFVSLSLCTSLIERCNYSGYCCPSIGVASVSRGICLIAAATRWAIQTKLNEEAPRRTLAGGARTPHAALLPSDSSSRQRLECTQKNEMFEVVKVENLTLENPKHIGIMLFNSIKSFKDICKHCFK